MSKKAKKEKFKEVKEEEVETNSEPIKFEVKEEEFVEWWYNKEQDVLRKKLSEQLGFSTEKLGKGRGVVFG